VVGCTNGRIALWDVTTEEVRWIGVPVGGIDHLAVSPDGRLLASSSAREGIRLHDIATGQEKLVLLGHTGTVASLSFSPDGRQLISTSLDRTIRIWDAPP
jgi:WD40 repeat protein